METLPVVLVVASTFMHVGWNLMVRQKGGAQACIWRIQVTIVVLGAAPAALSLATYPSLSKTALLCLLGSGTSCAFYLTCLARSYDSGDFTTVYPAARALPVLLVGLGDVVRGFHPTLLGWVGMSCVAAGCLLVPLDSFRDFRLRNYWNEASLWIVLTALGTVGYSLFDKIGTEAIPRGPREAAVYCYVLFLVSTVSCIIFKRFIIKDRPGKPDVGWAIPVLAAALSFSAYWLVLCAYQMVERASYIVAFRQFSIVIGAAVGFVLLKESGRSVRLAGAVVITAGLIVLKLFAGS